MRRRRRRSNTVAVLPILCTLANLVAGFAAIHYASKDPGSRVFFDWTPLTFAGVLIFVGMFFDAIDGSIARLTRSESDIGAQLDSLADMVTFGVAPAYMTLRLVTIHLNTEDALWVIGPEADSVFGKVVWAAAAVYVSCAALRLARFNVENDHSSVNEHRMFRGLPSPGAAGAVASLAILHQHVFVTLLGSDIPQAYVKAAAVGIPFVMMLCAFAMVSAIPYVHVANKYLGGARSFTYIVRVVVVLALLLWWLQVTLAVAFTAYALSGPIRLIMHRMRGRAVPPTPTLN